MDSPLNHHTEPTDQQIHFDLSPERLDTMSPAELADEMERALDAMTEETYDPAVIDAYLEALDRKVPVPEHPDSQAAYHRLQQTLQPLVATESQKAGASTGHGRSRIRERARIALVAAILVAGLFGGMIVAQASGLDVFGAIARWTDSAFSFGKIPSDQPKQNTSGATLEINQPALNGEIWEAYQQFQEELYSSGIDNILLPAYLPEGFQVESVDFYVSKKSDRTSLLIVYTNGLDYINFSITRSDTEPVTIYEKDNQAVELYDYAGNIHYIFSNNGDYNVAWYADRLEYSLSTTFGANTLKDIIDYMYKER